MIKNKIIFFLILGLFSFNSVDSVSCYINSCQDIRGLSGLCPIVYLNISLNITGSTCITMGSQNFDLNGKFIQTGYGSSNGGTSLSIVGSGSVSNGRIIGKDGSSAPYTNYVVITSSQIGSIVFNNISFESYGSGNAGSYIYIGSGSDIVYFNNCNITTTSSSSSYVFYFDIYNNVYFTNVSIYDTGSTYRYSYLRIRKSNLNITFYATQLWNFNNGLYNYGMNNTNFNIYSARFCSNIGYDLYNTVLSNNTNFNNLGNEFYADFIYGNYTLTGNNKKNCFEYQGYFENLSQTYLTLNQTIILLNISLTDLINRFNILNSTLINYTNSTNLIFNALNVTNQDQDLRITGLNYSFLNYTNSTDLRITGLNNSFLNYTNSTDLRITGLNNSFLNYTNSTDFRLDSLNDSLNDLNITIIYFMNESDQEFISLNNSISNLSNSTDLRINALNVTIINLSNTTDLRISILNDRINALNYSIQLNLTILNDKINNISESGIGSQIVSYTSGIGLNKEGLILCVFFIILSTIIILIYRRLKTKYSKS